MTSNEDSSEQVFHSSSPPHRPAAEDEWMDEASAPDHTATSLPLTCALLSPPAGEAGTQGGKGDAGENGVGVKGSSGEPGTQGKQRQHTPRVYVCLIDPKHTCQAKICALHMVDTHTHKHILYLSTRNLTCAVTSQTIICGTPRISDKIVTQVLLSH